MTRNGFKKEAAEAIIECLENGYTGCLCDLHNKVFNTDYYETSKYSAIEWFSDYKESVFDVVEEIKNYEQDMIGEVNTDFSNPCKVLNMFWYIIGEETLGELMTGENDYSDFWCGEMTEEDSEKIANIFKEKMKTIF